MTVFDLKIAKIKLYRLYFDPKTFHSSKHDTVPYIGAKCIKIIILGPLNYSFWPKNDHFLPKKTNFDPKRPFLTQNWHILT